MITQIMAVRDRAIDSFGQPFFAQAIGQATRQFADAVNSGKQDDNLALHPEDFDLYHLGTYDDAGAKFDLLPQPRLVSIGKDQVKTKL